MAQLAWTPACILETGRVLSYVGTWIALSAGVILYNKWVLTRSGFPFPISLTMLHMAFSATLAATMIHLLKLTKPIKLTRAQYVGGVVPVGALFAGTLWFGNAAYLHLSVSFIQMLKAFMPVLVYAVGLQLGTERWQEALLTKLAVITAGVVFASFGEVNFVLVGFLLQAASMLCEATRLTLVQILLTRKGLGLNSITTLYYVAPACFGFLLVPWVALELPVLLDSGDVRVRPLVLLTNCMCAFFLNLLIGKTSALTMNVAGVVKDWLLIGLSAALFGAPVSGQSLLGYGVAFVGVCLYNYQKMLDKQRAETDVESSAAGEEKAEKHASPGTWKAVQVVGIAAVSFGAGLLLADESILAAAVAGTHRAAAVARTHTAPFLGSLPPDPSAHASPFNYADLPFKGLSETPFYLSSPVPQQEENPFPEVDDQPGDVLLEDDVCKAYEYDANDKAALRCPTLKRSFLEVLKQSHVNNTVYFASVAYPRAQTRMVPNVARTTALIDYHARRLTWTFQAALKQTDVCVLFFVDSEFSKDRLMGAHCNGASVALNIYEDACEDGSLEDPWGFRLTKQRISDHNKYLAASLIIQAGYSAYFLDTDAWFENLHVSDITPSRLPQMDIYIGTISESRQDSKRTVTAEDTPACLFNIMASGACDSSPAAEFQYYSDCPIAERHRNPSCRGEGALVNMTEAERPAAYACVCTCLILFHPTARAARFLDHVLMFLRRHIVWEQDLISKLLPLHIENGLVAETQYKELLPGIPAGPSVDATPIPTVYAAHSGHKTVKPLTIDRSFCGENLYICDNLSQLL